MSNFWRLPPVVELNPDSDLIIDLVAWWLPGVSTLKSLTGRGDGDWVGGSNDPVWIRDPVFGWSLKFDGVNDYITVGAVRPVTYLPSTITAWYKSSDTAVTDDEYIYRSARGADDGSGTFREFMLNVTDDSGNPNGIRFFYTSSVANTVAYGTSNVKSDQQWHHLAATVSASKMSVYVDGVKENTVSVANTSWTHLETDAGPYIGDNPGDTEQVTGQLNHVMLWNRVLSDNDIWRLYAPQTRFGLFRTPPKYWRFVVGGDASPIIGSVSESISFIEANQNNAVLGASITESMSINESDQSLGIFDVSRLDSALLAHIQQALGIFTKQITSSLIINESSSSLVTLLGAVSDGLAIVDVNLASTILRAFLSDGIDYADVINAYNRVIAVINESVNINDNQAANLILYVLLSNTINLSDITIADKTVLLQRLDGLLINESMQTSAVYSTSASDSFTASELLSTIAKFNSISTDTGLFSLLTQSNITAHLAASDIINFNEVTSAAILLSIVGSVLETLSLSELINSTATFNPVSLESINISDLITPSLISLLSSTETLNYSEAAVGNTILSTNVTESLTISDIIAATLTGVLLGAVLDNVLINDGRNISGRFVSQLQETLNLLENTNIIQTILTSIIDSTNITSNESAGLLYSGIINQILNTSDLTIPDKKILSHLVDNVDFSENSGIIVRYDVQVAEALNLVEVLQTSFVFRAVLTEVLNILGIESAVKVGVTLAKGIATITITATPINIVITAHSIQTNIQAK